MEELLEEMVRRGVEVRAVQADREESADGDR
jgi:hypothetical protein